MHHIGRIGNIAEHERHILPALRRLGFRTMIRRRNGRTDRPSAMFKCGAFSLYVLLPGRGQRGLVAAWEGSGAQGVRILEHGWPMHLAEVTPLVNGCLAQIELLTP